MSEMILGGQELTVDFPGTRAVDAVSLEVRPREVVAVVGANGSGKTTLLSVLCGVLSPTSGYLYDDNGKISFATPRDAGKSGIILAPQEPQLAETLSVWENLCLSERTDFAHFLLPKWQAAEFREEANRLLPGMDPDRPASSLRKGDRALLALAAALRRRPRLLALDEPTAVLGEAAVEVVRASVQQVLDDGGAGILVSHRMRDVIELATRVIILVDGRATFEAPTASVSAEDLVQHLAYGKETNQSVRTSASFSGPRYEQGEADSEKVDPKAILSIRNLTTEDGLKIDALDVFPGEIVGLAGLGGSGRSRLLRIVAGVSQPTGGTVDFLDRSQPSGVRRSRMHGIAYIPEDRTKEAIFTPLDVTQNLVITERVALRPQATFASPKLDRRMAIKQVRSFGIVTAGLASQVTTLSGGNQQRAILARALVGNPPFLVADEPTQGVDTAGRSAIHDILHDYVNEGGAVLLSISEFEELLELATRVVAMRDGHLVADFGPARPSYAELLTLTSDSVVSADQTARAIDQAG